MSEPVCVEREITRIAAPDNWYDCTGDVCTEFGLYDEPDAVLVRDDDRYLTWLPTEEQGESSDVRLHFDHPGFNPLSATVTLRMIIAFPDIGRTLYPWIAVRGKSLDGLTDFPKFLWNTRPESAIAGSTVEFTANLTLLTTAPFMDPYIQIAPLSNDWLNDVFRLDYASIVLCDTADGSSPTGIHAPILLQFLGV